MISEFFKRYCLHDTSATQVNVCSDGITFSFSDGIYNIDERGRETELTPACELKILIDDFIDIEHYNADDISNSVVIHKSRKGKIREIDFDEFCAMLRVGAFDILNCYFSPFNSELLISGCIGKFSVYLSVIDVTDITVTM